MDIWTIGLLVLVIGLLLIIQGQASKIKMLKKQHQPYMPQADNAELRAAAKAKLETIGPIKTVKFLREETGMSLLEAKQYVDRLQ